MYKAFTIFTILLFAFGCTALSSQQLTQADNASNAANLTNESMHGVLSCLQKYGLTDKFTFFIYADWCPYCAKMKPWVQQLQEKHNIVWINAENSSAVKIISECLSGIAQLKYIPEFVCPANGESHIGAFASIEEMDSFMTKCEE